MKVPPHVSLALTLLSAPLAQGAITLGSLDTFDSSNEGWRIGGAGAQPAQQSGLSFNGQPGFLSHFSDGVLANGRWLMWTTESDWTGDYASAGVRALSFWADNRSGDPLAMRVALLGPGGFFYSNALTITNSTGGDDWGRLVFDLEAANFDYAPGSGGSQQFADTLANVSRFEILGGDGTPTYQSRGQLLRADTSVNTVWIDNVAAIPEPSVGALACLAGGLALLRRRVRRA